MSDLYPHGLPGTDTVELPPRQEKFPEGIRVELNTADTATLKKIPGIGSYYARRIVDYRNRLGGFVSVAQLKEMGSCLKTSEDGLRYLRPYIVRYWSTGCR